MTHFNYKDMKFRTSTLTYPGSAGRPHPKCIYCGGRGTYWAQGGDSPKNYPSEENSWGRMPGPGMDYLVTCGCSLSGWQYFDVREIELVE